MADLRPIRSNVHDFDETRRALEDLDANVKEINSGDIDISIDDLTVNTLTIDALEGILKASGGVVAGNADFIDLNDVPGDYTGQSGKVVAVNGTEDGLEFIVGGGGGSTTFLGLTDVNEPNYTGHGEEFPQVNFGETALEFYDLFGGTNVWTGYNQFVVSGASGDPEIYVVYGSPAAPAGLLSVKTDSSNPVGGGAVLIQANGYLARTTLPIGLAVETTSIASGTSKPATYTAMRCLMNEEDTSNTNAHSGYAGWFQVSGSGGTHQGDRAYYGFKGGCAAIPASTGTVEAGGAVAFVGGSITGATDMFGVAVRNIDGVSQVNIGSGVTLKNLEINQGFNNFGGTFTHYNLYIDAASVTTQTGGTVTNYSIYNDAAATNYFVNTLFIGSESGYINTPSDPGNDLFVDGFIEAKEKSYFTSLSIGDGTADDPVISESSDNLVLQLGAGDTFFVGDDGSTYATSTVALAVYDSSSTAALGIISGSASTSSLFMGDAGNEDIGKIAYDNSTNAMAFTTNATEQLTISSAGVINATNLTTTGAYGAVIADSSGDLSFVDVNGASANDVLSWNGANIVWGALSGIGAAPDDLTYIVQTSDAALANALELTAGDDIDITFAGGLATIDLEDDIDVTTITIGDGVGTDPVISESSNSLVFQTDSTSRWTIDGSTGALFPSSDKTYDIGIIDTNRVDTIFSRLLSLQNETDTPAGAATVLAYRKRAGGADTQDGDEILRISGLGKGGSTADSCFQIIVKQDGAVGTYVPGIFSIGLSGSNESPGVAQFSMSSDNEFNFGRSLSFGTTLNVIAVVAGASEINFYSPDDADSNYGRIKYDHNINNMAISTSGGQRLAISSAGVINVTDLTTTGDYGAVISDSSGDLSFVDVNGASANDVLTWNGANIVWAAGGGGGATELDDLTDVTITGTPAAHSLLVYNDGSAVWENLDRLTQLIIGDDVGTDPRFTESSGDLLLTLAVSASFTVVPSGGTGDVSITVQTGAADVSSLYLGNAADADEGGFEYDNSANTLTARAAGSDIVIVNSFGIDPTDTNKYIGLTTPFNQVRAEEFYVGVSGGTNPTISELAIDGLSFNTASTPRLTITSAGVVNIADLTTNGFVTCSSGDLSSQAAIDISSDTNLSAVLPLFLDGDELKIIGSSADYFLRFNVSTNDWEAINHYGIDQTWTGSNTWTTGTSQFVDGIVIGSAGATDGLFQGDDSTSGNGTPVTLRGGDTTNAGSDGGNIKIKSGVGGAGGNDGDVEFSVGDTLIFTIDLEATPTRAHFVSEDDTGFYFQAGNKTGGVYLGSTVTIHSGDEGGIEIASGGTSDVGGQADPVAITTGNSSNGIGGDFSIVCGTGASTYDGGDITLRTGTTAGGGGEDGHITLDPNTSYIEFDLSATGSQFKITGTSNEGVFTWDDSNSTLDFDTHIQLGSGKELQLGGDEVWIRGTGTSFFSQVDTGGAYDFYLEAGTTHGARLEFDTPEVRIEPITPVSVDFCVGWSNANALHAGSDLVLRSQSSTTTGGDILLDCGGGSTDGSIVFSADETPVGTFALDTGTSTISLDNNFDIGGTFGVTGVSTFDGDATFNEDLTCGTSATKRLIIGDTSTFYMYKAGAGLVYWIGGTLVTVFTGAAAFAGAVSTTLGGSGSPTTLQGGATVGIAATQINLDAGGGTDEIQITSAQVAPGADDTVDLGASGTGWKDLYVSGEMVGAPMAICCGYPASSSSTNVVCYCAGYAISGTALGYAMPKAGSVIAVSMNVDINAYTSGDVEVEVRKYTGSYTSLLAASFTPSGVGNSQTVYGTAARGTHTFAAGDIIQARRNLVNTPVGITTDDLSVVIVVQFDT